VSVEFIGMIGVSPEGGDSRVHVIDGSIDPDYIVDFSKSHEDAGFDMVLVGYSSGAADGLAVAQHAAAGTSRLRFLVAHRPGFVAPTLAARKFATLDRLCNGRIAVHIITGVSDAEQAGDGDFLAKDDRYRRSLEYMQLLRRTWVEAGRFDHEGEFYHVRGAHSDIRPLQSPHPPIFFGGSSPSATLVGGQAADVYALFGEPRSAVAKRMAEIGQVAAGVGREIGFSVSLRPIIGETEQEAWDKAHGILAAIESSGARFPDKPLDKSAARMLAHADRQDVHDERLWMGIAKATGAVGNTSCLVGTPEQVAESIAAYHALGVQRFLLRGFDPLADATDFGHRLLPLVREMTGG
jgi:alkanesulfonate monooxygenase